MSKIDIKYLKSLLEGHTNYTKLEAQLFLIVYYNKGEINCSLRKLAKTWGWSLGKVRTFINSRKEEIYFINNIKKNKGKDVFIENSQSWKTSFEVYKLQLDLVYESLIKDKNFIKEQERFHPGVDIILSLEKAYANFWGTEAGWKFKKRKKTKIIDWNSTLINAIDINKVWKNRDTNDNGLYTYDEALTFVQKKGHNSISKEFKITNSVGDDGKKLWKLKKNLTKDLQRI